MIAAGRVVKELYPDAMTVFVGPGMAKKKEAKRRGYRRCNRLCTDVSGSAGHFSCSRDTAGALK